MPLQNRVDPHGNLFRTQARGTMMGNRGGALHNDRREIARPYLNRRWICCLLEFKGRRRSVMSPGRYTELFFLDEAVAFSAGHRPCAECRRERFREFQNAWRRAHGLNSDQPVRAAEMDVALQQARIGPRGEKVIFESPLNSIPGGCFVEIDGAACLLWGRALLLWTAEGYTERIERPGASIVKVLTPRPVVECFRAGYVPAVHASAAL